MYAGRLELHLILQKNAWDRPRVPNFRSRRAILEKRRKGFFLIRVKNNRKRLTLLFYSATFYTLHLGR